MKNNFDGLTGIITALMAVVFIYFSFCFCNAAACYDDVVPSQEPQYYARVAEIVEFDTENDEVICDDGVGFRWVFEGIEDYEIGDLIAMLMCDNGTQESITDDFIVDQRYSGWSVGR